MAKHNDRAFQDLMRAKAIEQQNWEAATARTRENPDEILTLANFSIGIQVIPNKPGHQKIQFSKVNGQLIEAEIAPENAHMLAEILIANAALKPSE